MVRVENEKKSKNKRKKTSKIIVDSPAIEEA